VTQRLSLSTLAVRNLRNLVRVDLETGPRFNVISGDNGQGKTNLLEAVYVVATSKSFRATKPGDLVRLGDAAGSVRATLVEDGAARVQSVGLEQGKRHVRIDEKRPHSLVAYAVRTPAVVFHPGEISLSMGAGAERRRLLDRVSLYVAPEASGELADYTRALRERQRTLETRGPSSADLEDWEEILVRVGLGVMARRRETALLLGSAARSAFEQIAEQGSTLDVAYAPGAPEGAEPYRKALGAHRATDARRGFAKVGPHRDDLDLSIDGHPARGVASQGQHRAVVLALKSAEVDVIARARGVRPLLLLDEVSSELDRARTASLFGLLRRHEGQVFLTTTRPELIDTGSLTDASLRVDFRVSRGHVERA